MKFHYGITLETYNALVERAGARCEICGCYSVKHKQTHLHLDHNHRTGQARGILCHLCNRGLGYFQDDPGLLIKAAKYLINNNKYLLSEGEE